MSYMSCDTGVNIFLILYMYMTFVCIHACANFVYGRGGGDGGRVRAGGGGGACILVYV